MFIVDWSEDDFGALNFYDMYDILYPKVNGQYVPYIADDNLAVSCLLYTSHSLGDEQYKRLMAYMKALQKLEQMESLSLIHI